jgi:hypothetical protein
MAFKEPVGAYFAHHRDEAVHVPSGQTIVGYLNLESVGVQGSDLSPDINFEQEPRWECSRAKWHELGIRSEDHLLIDGETWIIEGEPKGRVIADVPLRRLSPHD